MHRLLQIKENLLNAIQAQVAQGLSTVDTKELGEAIDMLKDMEEAMYYCSVVAAMEERKQHTDRYPAYLDGKMYYNGGRRGRRLLSLSYRDERL